MMNLSEIKSCWDELLEWYDKNNISNALVAFSGGKDSTLVLDSAFEALDDVIAVIIDDVMYPDKEIEEAIKLSEEIGAEYQVIETDKLSNENLKNNPPERCYHCKKELFSSIEGEGTILEGTNASEVKGHRPGLEAVKDYARAPLLENDIGEEEVRDILRWRGREIWDKPSFACLASRIPTGTELTKEELEKIERIEKKIFGLGVKQLRLRDFGDAARIEVWPEDMEKIIENREKIVKWLKDEGYEKIFLDIEGYRCGSISGV